jgi:hypothetical protein
MSYYKVGVKETVEVEDAKGNVKEKSIKKNYLVEALSVTEAEANAVTFIGIGDFEVKSVREEKLEAVILKGE